MFVKLFEDAKENASTFVKINGVTYIDTGDQAYIDEKGRLWYVTRNKRIIRTQDGKIFVNVIENLLEQIEEIIECCVVAIPHSKMVKAASCHIVLKSDCFSDATSLEKTVLDVVSRIECKTGKMYTYYVPNTYEFRKSMLPKTSLGKIDFMQLEKENADMYDKCKGNVPKIRRNYEKDKEEMVLQI